MKITIETTIDAPMEEVWRRYTTPEDVVQWNFASNEWHCPSASIDLREGGRFTSRMESKDGAHGFDFTGVYTKVIPNELIEYVMDDDRSVSVQFLEAPSGIKVITTFDAEQTYSIEQQRAGWQAILDNFTSYVMQSAN